ncbi:MAG TPA: phospholipid carrier-dependent glycosyltransferase [Jatrophihabitans sp.]|jgi:dolichyl-phosphate-mannose--protein O-mannosyl transferase
MTAGVVEQSDARLDTTEADEAGFETAVPQPPQPPIPESLQPWRDPNPLMGWAITGLVTVFAVLTRFWAIGFPQGKNFDEVYYATEAQEMLRWGYEDNRGYMFIVHPPLGKWLIAITSDIWGNNTLGWRIAPAAAGTVAVIIMTRLARRMFRSNLFGAIAGVLLGMDGLTLVLSRTAILDIFLELFVLAGFAALVVDRDWMRTRLARMVAAGVDFSAGVPALGPRPWRIVAGVMFGFSLAVKWSALSFWVVFVILSLIWDRAALRAAGAERNLTVKMLRRSAMPAIGSLLLVTLGSYLITYLGWITGENGWNRYWADTHSTHGHIHFLGVRIPMWWGWVPSPIRGLASNILDAYRFHEGLDSGHTYQSSPWSWLVDGRPVDFYYNGDSKGCGASSCSREILALGTPLIWWAFAPMLLWLAWHWFTTRDWRAAAIWVAFAAGWLVWFQDLKRTMFFFYMAPLVPFMVLGITMGLGAMLGPSSSAVTEDGTVSRRRYWGIAGVALYLGLVAADFAFMWPVFTGGLLTYNQWHLRMWLPSWV